MSKKIGYPSLIQLFLAAGILIFVNILGSVFHAKVDLTEEKRYTLTKPSVQLLEALEEVVYVQVLLEGNFPAGFKRLQNSTLEMLEDFRGINGLIEYQFINPSEGSVEEINAYRAELAKAGIVPTNLRVKDVDETKEQQIYPWAIFNFKGRSIPVNLLENEMMGVSPEVVLNNSVSLLEYKFANAIHKLEINRKPNILFTQGHGELADFEVESFRKELSTFYNTGFITLDSVVQIKQDADALIIAKPRLEFNERDKFKIDQFIMNGGKVMWLVDRLGVDLDSLRGRKDFIPFDYPLKIEDMLFKYGVRIQPNLILDLECTKIPLVSGMVGNSPQFDLFPCYYNPLMAPTSNHPIAKSLDRVNLFFPSTIDTVQTKTNVKKTVLLKSSQYSRLQLTPVRLDLEAFRYDADASKFNKGAQNVAVLLEGIFPSNYSNRVTAEFQAGLDQLNLKFKDQSVNTKMLVISDGDIARNGFNRSSNQVLPLGYNMFERRIFGANKDFLVNSIEYLLDGEGIIEARSKEVKLRLLDTVKAKTEKTKWQMINILLPLVFVALFGFLYNLRRKRKFGS